jgi:acyl-coenzyme A thioesterase PaaI-like protein
MGPFVGSMPFSHARGMSVEHMAGNTSRIVMPLGEVNADLACGFHEGAVLALLDTTGAMAAWGAVGPGRFKASSAAIQAQILGSVSGEDLVGYGRVVQRDGELFWADVEIADVAGGHLQARGTVVYRIVT